MQSLVQFRVPFNAICSECDCQLAYGMKIRARKLACGSGFQFVLRCPQCHVQIRFGSEGGILKIVSGMRMPVIENLVVASGEVSGEKEASISDLDFSAALKKAGR